MQYEFVTENNLDNPQTYSYSVCNGEDFFKAYMNSRNSLIKEVDTTPISVDKAKANKHTIHVTREDLSYVMVENNCDSYADYLLDQYVKRFEISKRLYTKYDVEWKPTQDAEYIDYNIYMDLATCCMMRFWEMSDNGYNRS